MLTASYMYELPPEQIAQTPTHPRDHARMMVVEPQEHHHSRFTELPHWLNPGDLLVLNDTRVIPARLYGSKPTGAHIEILLLEQQDPYRWLTLVKPGRRIRVGDHLHFAQGLVAEVEDTDPATGGRILRFEWPEGQDFFALLQEVGETPLPPYITQTQTDPEEYQTIWASQPGSVAAPTAGLHFTQELLNQLQAMGVQTATLTLTIGLGTFRPVETETVTGHTLHQEWIQVSDVTVKRIRQTQAQQGRILAVGTTVTRALESAAQSGHLVPWQGKSDLFIYPGYRWRVIDGLITNFHLPRSSLLMMISALVGRQRVLELYQDAILNDYRFYSFGDGMLILP